MMRTNGWKKAVCVMGIGIAMITGITAKAQNGYVTNDVVEDEKVISRIIYRNEDGLQYHMKYDFTYDDQNRMLSKETSRWDRRRKCWSPNTKLTYRYMDTQVVLEHARWSKEQNAYNVDIKHSVYELSEDNMPVAQLIRPEKDRGRGRR
ncbi:MAG: DUF3836 domain-containing protein [Bacteroides sp.]|nr:DUF3836 domain-containing protein [Bacteroides sp.]